MAKSKEQKAKQELRRDTDARDHDFGFGQRIATMPETEYLKMKQVSKDDPDIENRMLRDNPQHLVQPRKKIGLPKRKKVFTVPRLPWKE